MGIGTLGIGTIRPATLLVDTGISLNILQPQLAACRMPTAQTVTLAGFAGGSQNFRMWQDIAISVGSLQVTIIACENR